MANVPSITASNSSSKTSANTESGKATDNKNKTVAITNTDSLNSFDLFILKFLILSTFLII